MGGDQLWAGLFYEHDDSGFHGAVPPAADLPAGRAGGRGRGGGRRVIPDGCDGVAWK